MTKTIGLICASLRNTNHWQSWMVQPISLLQKRENESSEQKDYYAWSPQYKT
ncbi:hypothetical protein [Peribacillus simplex]|uniref:hypothetical protein n=1 Tax=Peribacillus simplex TaxID=1478 RepID=UPI0036D769F7